jgi:Site-specific recombinase XerD
MSKQKQEASAVPSYTRVKRRDNYYLRARVYDADGKRIDIYGKDEAELTQKVLQAQKEIEAMRFSKFNPTVAEYSEKWLEMQKAHVRPSTLRGYELAVRKCIIGPLRDLYMSEVTADDIKMAMVPVSKMSEGVYNKVNMLFKSIFYSAEYSNLIKDNPAKNINAKGGVPQKEKEALTDEQAAQLLDTIRDLPPYVFVMIGLYAGLRREEILALQWDCVHLEARKPFISVRRAWHSDHNRPVISRELKTPAARRDVPIPQPLVDCLREEKKKSKSEYVIADRDGQPLSYSQFVRIWNYIRIRSTKERTIYKYVNGQAIKKKFKPEPGQRCVNRENIIYCLDFTVTPHQLRHTYITNLIYAGVDPKTVQYLAGHENSKVTMDIYAKAKYNKPEELSEVVNDALKK